MLVDRAARATLRRLEITGLHDGGIVLTHAGAAVVGQTTLAGLGNAGVLVHGPSPGVAVLRNEIVGNRGGSNWSAGIVVTDRSADVSRDPFDLLHDDRYWAKEQPIESRLDGPRGTVIAFNRVALNAASGVYSDGGIQSVIVGNRIEGNAKEGLCLDNGSTGNVVAMNTVRQNGKRWGHADAELRLDFVQQHGRLADGSSASKTPGVSIDNAIYNTIFANQIDGNFGGGVKFVRTAFYNLVAQNIVIDNNRGAGEKFHFFGIELGAASADAPSPELDFLPSRGNLVVGNIVQGSHDAGIFFGPGSTDNDSFDNTIFGATHWAMEQTTAQPNASLNNLTNLPSRNIGNGLDPKLVRPARP